ncbi:MAG: 4Fe-4S binding protein, partial [SAR324 cluster bacterium]|nr:4Fe-4S binding protein [SAR324 cluster bacterium]
MKELVIISGKGGTGKTSISASFALLAPQPVIVDCDVDASNLHLVLAPKIKEQHNFYSGYKAFIRQEDCINCGDCLVNCNFKAIEQITLHDEFASDKNLLDCESCDYCKRSCSRRINSILKEMGATLERKIHRVNQFMCEGCGVCVRVCPKDAIDFQEELCGAWILSETRAGLMLHAKMNVAAENSGRLVSTIRKEARRVAKETRRSLIIIDGPPGNACPVIASITGADLALIVTEATVSGEHDLERVLALTRHFGIKALVCINKWDINPKIAEQIEEIAS